MSTVLLKLFLILNIAAGTLAGSAGTVADAVRHTGTMTVKVYDYGNSVMSGEAILVSSRGRNLLMDTAFPDNVEDPSQCTVMRHLKEDGVQELDLYLSHWHNDHYFLLTTIMNDPFFHIGKIYLPEVSEELSYADPSHSEETWYRDLTRNIPGAGPSWGPHSYSEILETTAQKGIEIVWLDEGSVFTVGDARAEVLWHRQCNYPYGKTVVPYLNDRSLVTMITCSGIRYLTCGDLHKENERAILKAGIDVQADILKASHHADITSNCVEWIEAVHPSLILSTRLKTDSGTDPELQKSCEERLKDYCQLLSVRETGDITIHVENGVITVTTAGKIPAPSYISIYWGY